MSSLFETMRKQFSYLVSLPERTIRSLAALATGTTNLLTESLFPESLRGTTVYKIFIGDAQKFVMEKVAEVQREATEEPPSDPRYLHRKMVGGALETAGLFAMHVSPLWIFAIAGDAAAGSRVFLNRLVEQLKRNGVIDENMQVTKLDDLLMAMHETSRSGATAVDTPPLSRAEVEKLADEMMDHYGNVFSKATGLLPKLDDLWSQMERLASRDNVSLERLEGILSLDVLDYGRRGVGAALAVGQTGTTLFGEQILDSYAVTLEKMNKAGVMNYVGEEMKPFFDAAMGHFSPGRKTWTDSVTDLFFGGGATEAGAETGPGAHAEAGAATGDIHEAPEVKPPPTGTSETGQDKSTAAEVPTDLKPKPDPEAPPTEN